MVTSKMYKGQTDGLRSAHRNIEAAIDEIEGLLSGLPQNAADVRSKLNTMGGALRIHLAMEDKVLYPRLLESRDAKLQTLGRDASQTIIGLADAFNEFSDKWREVAIRSDAAGFKSDWAAIVKVLGDRIGWEERVLYPAVETV